MKDQMWIKAGARSVEHSFFISEETAKLMAEKGWQGLQEYPLITLASETGNQYPWVTVMQMTVTGKLYESNGFLVSVLTGSPIGSISI